MDLIQIKYLAVIPARAGSKRLPRKNMIPFCGKPLIHWTVAAAIKSLAFEDIIVSTDDDDVVDYCQKNFKDEITIKFRDASLSTDTVSSIDVVLDATLGFASAYGVVLLQPTSPTRSPKLIVDAIETMEKNGCDALITMSELHGDSSWLYAMNDSKRLVALCKHQETKDSVYRKTFTPNGAIYISMLDRLRKQKSFLGEDSHPLVLNPYEVIDIDTYEDFRIAELVFRQTLDLNDHESNNQSKSS